MIDERTDEPDTTEPARDVVESGPAVRSDDDATTSSSDAADVEGPDVAEPDADADADADGDQRPAAWIPWTVAAAALVLALVAVLQWQSARGAIDARADAGRAAATFVTTLTTWDAADGLDDTYEQLVDLSAEEFVAEVDTVFGQQERVDAEATSARSEGTVVEVLTSDDDQGVRAAVLVEQTLVSDAQPTPVTARRTALVDLTNVDGQWRVAGLELLSELLRGVEGG